MPRSAFSRKVPVGEGGSCALILRIVLVLITIAALGMGLLYFTGAIDDGPDPSMALELER